MSAVFWKHRDQPMVIRETVEEAQVAFEGDWTLPE